MQITSKTVIISAYLLLKAAFICDNNNYILKISTRGASEHMNKNKITEKLIALSKDNSKRTIISQLRDIYETIENTLSAGVSKKVVVEELKNSGFEINFKTFDSSLKRIRKERKNSGKESLQKQPPINKELKITPEKKLVKPTLNDIINDKPDLEKMSREYKKLKKGKIENE